MHGGPAVGGKRAQLDLVPEDSAALKRAAKKLKLKLSVRESGFLVQGDDRVGAMPGLPVALAKAKVSVTACDAVTAGEGRYGAIFWVKPAAVAKASKAIGAR